MKWIDVISAGPGSAGMLTEEAGEAIARADAVFCADRYAGLVADPGKRRALLPFTAAMGEMETLRKENRQPAVLVSGDAGLYSLLPLMEKRFGRDALRVYPGVSSLQAFCARLCIPWQEAAILSAHGRNLSPSALCHAARTHARTLLLTDEERDPNWVRKALDDGELGPIRITVGERISCAGERIAPYACRTYDPLSVVLLENDQPEKGLPAIGIPDDAFIRGKTPMTKREIRIQVLASLALPPDAVVWDIGAGTGSVSIECARQCPLGQVYAIERDEDALQLIRENRERFHAQNLEIVAGSAPEALKLLPAPTHLFIGGAGGRIREMLEITEEMDTPVRLCATAVTLESAEEYRKLFQTYRHFTALQIAVSRIEPIGTYHMFRAQNPVFIFSAETGGKA